MNKLHIVDELILDHWQMRGLLKDLRDSSARLSRKQRSLKRLGQWVKLHTRGESQTINKFGRLHRATQVLAYEDKEEHAVVLALYEKLQRSRANPQLWAARVHLLAELIEHHLDEEEEEYFPLLRKLMSPEESERLAKRYRALTEDLDSERPPPPSGLFGWLSPRPYFSQSDSNFL